MPGISDSSRFDGLPVVTAPAEIDVITAEKLRMCLLQAAANGHATIVVDLTGTRSCDSSELDVLDAAHRRALDEGGELRLVLPPDGSVVRVLAITGLNRCIPCFTGLDQALAAPRSDHRLPGTFPNTALTDPAIEERRDGQTRRLPVGLLQPKPVRHPLPAGVRRPTEQNPAAGLAAGPRKLLTGVSRWGTAAATTTVWSVFRCGRPT